MVTVKITSVTLRYINLFGELKFNLQRYVFVLFLGGGGGGGGGEGGGRCISV